MFSHPEAKSAVTPTYTTSGGSQLTISAAASMDTAFMKLMGYSNLDIKSSSTVKWGNNRLRVALALDNTGSMDDDGKIGALKTATKGLLDPLKAAATQNGDVYVSIVPFSKNVNVGTSTYTSANWVDWEDWEDDNGHDQSTTTCTTQKSGKNGKNKKKCSTTTSWVPDNHNTWNGCITDRDKNYDVAGTAPVIGTAATLFPAEQYDNCPVPMSGLSYDWNKMNSLVNTMKPDGTTNQTIGLVWAWMSLTGGGPFTVPAKDPNYKYQDIIILMSDGLNTENRWDGNGSSVSPESGMPAWRSPAPTRRRPGSRSGPSTSTPTATRPRQIPEELRDRQQQVLHRHLVGADRHGVHHHRVEPVAAAHLEVTTTGISRRPAGCAGLTAFANLPGITRKIRTVAEQVSKPGRVT